MQLKTCLLFLAAVAPMSSLARPEGHERRLNAKRSDWTSTPSGNDYSTQGFGSRTSKGGSSSGGGTDGYVGNVGSPYGSNIKEISENEASKYKYVVRVTGHNKEAWTVGFWNKIGANGGQNGFFGEPPVTFTLNSGETKYVAFDENTQAGMGAAKGSSGGLPKGNSGIISCTWGEFNFGDSSMNNASAFDVSAIQAQKAKGEVQGMQICNNSGSKVCSAVGSGGSFFDNAYSDKEAAIGGIGGNLPAGPVRLSVVIDYSH